MVAADGSTTTTLVEEQPEILPRPNSGREPRDAGDPGGAAQLGLAFAILVALVVIALLARRDILRSRARRAAADQSSESQASTPL